MKLELLGKKALLDGVVHWVEVEKQSTLAVLEYLLEIDRRRLHLEEGYAGLKDFCIRFLNYSEGEAGRRVQAALCLKKFPEVGPLLVENRLSLSGLSLVAPHLTPENIDSLLPLIEKKSTRDMKDVLCEKFGIEQAEFIQLLLDKELKELFEAVKKEYSEKNEVLLVKKAFREVLAKAKRKSWPDKHTRYVPKSNQREVKESHGHQCAYTSPTGIRCSQTGHLQIDHIRPWAKGGSSWDKSNLRVLCKAHNLMLARKDFPTWVFTPASARLPASDLARDLSPSFRKQSPGRSIGVTSR